MKTGDIVRDDQGRAFQIGQILGRGLWGKTYSVREEHGPEWALKVPLSQAELPSKATHLESVCREILLEQARLLTNNRLPFLPTIDSRITTSTGIPGILMQRLPLNLERRLSGGCTTDELLELCLQLSAAVRDLGSVLPGHGNITPNNVLLTEQGQVIISDPLTPTAQKHLAELRAAAGPRSRSFLPYQPPEVRSGGVAAGAVPDTYAIGMLLYWGTLASGEIPSRLPDTPINGLDKASLVALKDRVHNRLKVEGANPRFHTRLSDRTSALLNRALSEKTAPSPPYRFLDLGEFHNRVEHLLALVNPTVEHVGKILLDRPPGSDSYTTDEDVVFSCTIGCSSGVETHEEIACGLAVFDREKDERIRDLSCAYTVDSHPSGRLRFGFRLSELAPGSYTIRVAFKIRESSADPMVAEGRFERRAAPGYTPPRTRPTRRPIPLERPDSAPVTQTRTSPGVAPTLAPQPITHTGVRETPAPGLQTGSGVRVSPPPVRQPPPRTSRSAVAPRVVAPHMAMEQAEDNHSDAYEEPAPARIAPIVLPGTQTGSQGDSHRSASDEIDDQPLYDGVGNWSQQIPIPNTSPDRVNDAGEDIYSDNELDPDDDSEEYGLPGPIGGALERFFEMLRGDAYVMFIGGAAVIMVLLIVLLFALS